MLRTVVLLDLLGLPCNERAVRVAEPVLVWSSELWDRPLDAGGYLEPLEVGLVSYDAGVRLEFLGDPGPLVGLYKAMLITKVGGDII